MKQLLLYLKQTDKIWRLVWLFIFCSFITLDAFFPNFFGVTLLKLLGIALCFVFVLQKYSEDHRLIIAFGLTFLADIFLAFNNASLFGIFCFIIAQLFHFSRLKPLKKQGTIILTILITTAFLLSIFLERYTIFLLGAVYAFFLFSNIYLSYKWKKTAKSSQKKPAYFAFYGFILFSACDFCAACSFFATINFAPFVLKHLIDFLCWAFYYPSQVLISNSSNKKVSSVPKDLS